MAGSKSEAWEVEVLKMGTGQATSIITTTPIVPYLALFTGTLTADTPGTEATGGGYARVSTAGKWGVPVSGAGTVTNNAVISLGPFTGTVSAGAPFTHFGLFDALTGGNALYYGDLTDQSKTGANGDTITFASGALTLTEG
jgi:hypothetical protein